MATESRLKELGQYWDSIAVQNIKWKKTPQGDMTKISDNWDKRRQLISFLLQHPLKEGERILEIGAGIGSTIHMLAEIYGPTDIDYTSTETSPVFQNAMIKLRKRPCHIATIDDLPFGDNEFSRIWLFDVLEHVDPDTRHKAGLEVGRVLAPHGLIFINNPLSPSAHDDAFDFGFSQADIGNFCRDTETVMISLKTHSTFKEIFYQFIVLEKVYGS